MNAEVKCIARPSLQGGKIEFVVFNGLGTLRVDDDYASWRSAEFTDGYTPGKEDLTALKIQCRGNRHR